MSNTPIFYLVSSIVLLGIIPILVIKDFRNGKKLKDIILANSLWVVLLVICISEVLKSVLPPDSIHFVNQILFFFVFLFFGIPLLVILFMNLKKDSQRWNNPKNYNYLWLYKIRYIILFFFIALFVGALYKFYQSFMILFFQ